MSRWFQPRLLALHALAIVAVAACVVMGLWQLGVYGSKHEDRSAALRAAKPVPLLEVWGPDEPFTPDLDARPVWVRGQFSGDQFLVRRGTGQYWVVAPLRVADSSSMLLIVRGRTAERQQASLELPTGTVTFRGVLQPGEEGGPTGADRATGIHDAMSIPQLANVVDGDLFSGYALTDAAGITAGLEPVDPPDRQVSWTVGLRNLAYALQWWVFGLFSGFMWWRMATEAVAVEESLEPLDSLEP